MRNSLFSLLVVAAVAGLAFDASAYCRTTTCDPSTQNCNPPPGEPCTTVGKPLYWPNRCVSFNLQQDASASIDFDTFSAITRRAFLSWLDTDCGQGQRPSIEVHDLGPIACDKAEYNLYAGNANNIMFRDDQWPYPFSSHTLALTTVTFNTENGHIYDVDIEVNSVQMHITTGDTDIKYDLESILAHEIGHYFGLAHSREPTATMFDTYKRGEVGLRTPEADDYEGICAIYQVDRKAENCDPEPRRGLKTTCGDGSPPDGVKGCSVGQYDGSAPRWPVLLVFPLALGLAWRKRGRTQTRG
jgi:hypothetical protein